MSGENLRQEAWNRAAERDSRATTRQPEGDSKPDRNKAFDACPDSGCDWGSFWQGWKACHADAQRAIAELRTEIEELDALRKRQSDLLSQTAIALRGPEPALTRYSHADIPSRVKVVVGEIAELRQECERLRDVVVLKEQDTKEAQQAASSWKAERDTLRQQLAERDAEIMEQCRLNGMGAERELKLMTQRDKLAGLLREAINWDTSDELLERIDTALAEVNKP